MNHFYKSSANKEEFGARIAQAEREIAEGKGKTFANIEQMNDWLNSL
ncbi:MAG: hypothetical protein IJQ97_04835 [Paludibacteraceae bacterium]|nr:hypothetical protein [Paludibacteraceae bacterium]